MKFLITNADDFGWGVDITQGIVDAHHKGVLSSASVIISEIDSESLELAKSTPTLGLGLHLNIATGEPLTDTWKKTYGSFTHPVRKTVTDFYSQTMWEEHYGVFDEEIVFNEFDAQFARFQSLIGKNPDHLDTHYNTSCVEPVYRAYGRLAKKYNLPVRQPVGYRGNGVVKSFTTETSELIHTQDAHSHLRKEGVLMATYFSLEYINLHEDYVQAMRDEISKIKENESIEISFHPGYREDWRRKQVEILMDPRLKDALKEDNVKIITYSQLYEYSSTSKSSV